MVGSDAECDCWRFVGTRIGWLQITDSCHLAVSTTFNSVCTIHHEWLTCKRFLLLADCQAGSYAKDIGNGQYACELCPLATYQPDKGSVFCIQCNSEKTTAQLGTIRETDCTPLPTCLSAPNTCGDNQICTDTAAGIKCSCPAMYDISKTDNTSCTRELMSNLIAELEIFTINHHTPNQM